MHAMVNRSNNAAPPKTPPMMAFVVLSLSPDDLDLYVGGASAFALDCSEGTRDVATGGGGLYEFLLDDEGGGGDLLSPFLLFPFGGGGGDDDDDDEGGGGGGGDDEESCFGGGADELEPEDIFRAICPDMVY